MFWAEVSSRRWQAATSLERIHGTAICDTDPLKLHYSWALARVRRGDPARFLAQARATRDTFRRGRLGLADLILVHIPSPATRERQKQADRSRRRQAFNLHRLLADPLREWYAAVKQLDATRVLWHLPENGLAGLPASPLALIEAIPLFSTPS